MEAFYRRGAEDAEKTFGNSWAARWTWTGRFKYSGNRARLNSATNTTATEPAGRRRYENLGAQARLPMLPLYT